MVVGLLQLCLLATQCTNLLYSAPSDLFGFSFHPVCTHPLGFSSFLPSRLSSTQFLFRQGTEKGRRGCEHRCFSLLTHKSFITVKQN